MALVAGTSVGRYEIQSPLGAGGMGEVYLARDPLLSRTVAIKLLPTVFAGDPDRLRRFEQEAQASAALNHPRILAVHDVGRLGDQPFIVMEYVRGETLAAYMRRGRPSQFRALEIGIEIANALDAAHRARIVHRDLKPANVMVTGDGHVKVVDFGLAKFLQDDTSAPTIDRPLRTETITGQVLGTPVYMSPEQLLGDRVDERTDIYSLGVILFELVTGRRPHDGDVMELLRQAAQTTPVRTARDVDPAVTPEISQTIARCMARNAAARFQTAGELEAELQRLLVEGTSSAAFPASSAETVSVAANTRRLSRYAPWLLAAAVALGVAVIPLANRFGPTDTAGTGRPVIAVLPLANLSDDLSKAYLGIGIADTLTTSLARLSSISVVSRSSMPKTGALPRGTDEIARELGATMLVRGSVQIMAGDRLVVNATLVTPDGKLLWSGYAQGRHDDLFSMQNQLAESLLAALRITVTDADRQRLARPLTADPQALDEYWQGLALLDRPDDAGFDPAVENFSSAITRDPRFSLAFAALGEAYRRRSVKTNDTELMDKAIAAVTKALQLDPEQPAIRLSLAAVDRSTGRTAEATDEVRRVLKAQPNNDDAHRLLGQLLAGEGRSTEALEEFRLAASIRPQYWRNHEALALFFYTNRQLQEAIDEFTQVADLKPNDAMPFQQLGSMYLANGDLIHARQNFEKSNQRKPNAGSFTNLGTIAYTEHRYNDAVLAYEEAVKLEPGQAVYRGNLADAYRKLGRAADAKSAYLKAIELGEQALSVNANDVATASAIGVYYAKVGVPVKAQNYADQAARTNPTSPEVLYLRAVVLALNGRADVAVKQLQEAIDRGYAFQLALADDDLASLRSLPAFQRLAASAKKR